MVTMPSTAVEATPLAQRWLDALQAAIDARDHEALAELFVPHGHWRDIVAFTWNLYTFSGTDQLRTAFAEYLDPAQPSGFELDLRTAPRFATRAGAETVEALFRFRTAVGTGRGVLRLVVDDDGQPRAWVLVTALQELTGFEERTGPRRPRGEQYSRNFGGPNWLDKRREAVEYRGSSPTVLVVGGGQCGLAIAARLNALEVDTLVVDRMERVGDNWRKRYHALTLHNEVWVNHLPYMPFPDTWPVYIPKDKLAGWFEAYAEALEINFWTGTEFQSASWDEHEQRWTVRLRRGDEERVLHPHHVIMATGVSGIPSIPDIPGLSDFAGEVIHSSAHTTGTPYAGRRALVIGTGNSGHDVAQDLYSAGAAVTMVQRGTTMVVDVESAQKVYALYKEGIPTEDCDLISLAAPYPVLRRFYQLATEDMVESDHELIEALERVGFRTDLGDEGTGFQMKYLERGGGYYLNVGCSELIISGEIGLLQYADIDRLVPQGALLRSGEVVPADLVVLATGYKPQRELVRRLFGDDVADRVGHVWGFDERGELRNMWRRTAQPGLWFHAGSLAQSRIFSQYLALQIKAIEEKLIEAAMPPQPAAYAEATPPGAVPATANGRSRRDEVPELDESRSEALQ